MQVRSLLSLLDLDCHELGLIERAPPNAHPRMLMLLSSPGDAFLSRQACPELPSVVLVGGKQGPCSESSRVSLGHADRHRGRAKLVRASRLRRARGVRIRWSDPPRAWLSKPCDQPGRACSWVASAARPVHTEEQTCSSDALPLPSANGASMCGVGKICAQILTIALLC